LRAHILATSGSDTSGPPYLHNEEAVLAQHHWTGWNSRRMGPSLNVGQLSVPDAATLPAALPGWPGAADSMYQPAVPSMLFRNNINTLVPDVPDVQMAGAQPEPCEMSFGHGPRRHSNIRDVQYVRHSPYWLSCCTSHNSPAQDSPFQFSFLSLFGLRWSFEQMLS